MSLDGLTPLVGEWSLRFDAPWSTDDMPPAHVSFEWMPGERFLIQRWEVPIPEAPDGIALIGADPTDASRYLQHYFDTRGVARVYKMTLADGVWKLWRDEPDFSDFDFAQRFTGTFSDDGATISGTYEICHDGSTWERDFDATYAAVPRS